MIKIKYNGFTLPEVLITLTVVGALAAMVLPGLIKDMNNKANMALLQGTVANISATIQQEVLKKNAKTIEETDVYTNPAVFLKKRFDYKKETELFKTIDSEGNAVEVQYKTLNGSTKPAAIPKGEVLLANGVYVGIAPEAYTVVIDLNGPEPPNIIGVDYFELNIGNENDFTSGVHVGDVGGFRYDDKTDEEIKTECKNGSAGYCYALVERSGFNPNYLE